MSSTFSRVCTSTHYYTKDHVLAGFADEMRGKFVGPVNPQAFLDYFLPKNEIQPTGPMPTIAPDNFKLSLKGPQKYQSLIDALQPYCANGMTLVHTSSDHDTTTTEKFDLGAFKPALSLYTSPTSHLMPGLNSITTNNMELFIDFKKLDPSDEPFRDDDDPNLDCIEVETPRAHRVRGQLSFHLNTLQASGRRTCVFAVLINIKANLCRLVFHTRSCSYVTRGFKLDSDQNENSDAQILPSFFWRYTNASAELRGHDTSMEVISLGDSDDSSMRNLLGASQDAPLYKVIISNDTYIISLPFTSPPCHLLGRGTRCFRAYSCKTGTVVLLKDTWRVDGYQEEGKTYAILHEKNVPHISEILSAGDVLGPRQRCGFPIDGLRLRTKQQKRIRAHIHYRIVLKTIGTPLTRFPSTWDLSNATLCALRAHEAAFKDAKILHRDISAGNILIVDELDADGTHHYGGLLIDWELANSIDSESAPGHERMGTWQFLSVRLAVSWHDLAANSPSGTPIHDLTDDIESFIHVLVWTAARNAASTLSPKNRQRFLNIFDTARAESKRATVRAGVDEIKDLKLEQAVFSGLLKALWRELSKKYCSRWEGEPRMLDDHAWIVRTMEEFLREPGWDRTLGDRAIKYAPPDTQFL